MFRRLDFFDEALKLMSTQLVGSLGWKWMDKVLMNLVRTW